jgi:hypothetical protein
MNKPRWYDYLAFQFMTRFLPTPWFGWKKPVALWLLPYAGRYAYYTPEATGRDE